MICYASYQSYKRRDDSIERKQSSGRLRLVRTSANAQIILKRIMSSSDKLDTHQLITQISKDTEINKSPVRNVVTFNLRNCRFINIPVQVLTKKMDTLRKPMIIDPLTPTIRPLIAETIYENEVHKSFPTKEKPVEKQKVAKTLTWEDAGNDPKSSYIELAKLLSPTNDNLYEDVGDKTLNDSREEPLEESMIDDTGLLPKDLDGMQRAFLFWLRRSENMQLYNHILSLQPVALEIEEGVNDVYLFSLIFRCVLFFL
uniref:Uncharacterized protein n=1 Tax=Heterorhabditis bacteriophora TaxID=37862 RepID=A0A1I7W777_HETBA